MSSVLRLYRSSFERYFQRDGVEYDTYFDDWTSLLRDANAGEGYNSDQEGVFEALAVDERARRVRRSALLGTEYARFMAWLAARDEMGLYEEFEGVLRMERTTGEYPGVPVRDIGILN